MATVSQKGASSYHSRRSSRRLARKSKYRFVITLTIIISLMYATVFWILPYFIGSVGIVKNIVKPPQVVNQKSPQNAALAPPTLNIPYEATNSAEINIQGFGIPSSRVKLYLDDKSVQTIDVSNDGSFTFANVNLNLGTNNIYGTTLDEQEKESLPSKTIKLIYINEKPSLNLNSPADNTVITGGDKKVTVSGKVDPGIQVLVNGSQIVVGSDGNFSTDLSINEGDNTISVKATDAALNSTEIERKVTFKP